MDKLHQALLECVVSHLDPAALDGHAALKQLRLVDKRFAACVTPVLFSTVHLTRNADSFKRATAVAQDSDLVSNVRRLIYHTDRVSAQERIFDFRSLSSSTTTSETGSPDSSDSPASLSAEDQARRALYDNRLEQRRNQQSFIRTETEIEQLALLMTKFTGLTTLECSDNFSSMGSSESYISRRTGLPGSSLATGAPQRNLFRILTASFYADILVSSLTSQISDWQYFIKFGLCKDWLRGQLSGLRVLEVVFNHMWLVRLSELKKALDGFVSFLGAAPNLTSLKLEMGELPWTESAESHDAPRAVADVILKSIRWPKLKHLSISGLAASEQDIVSFFVAHAASLRTLRLGHVEMPLLGPQREERGQTGGRQQNEDEIDDDIDNVQKSGSIISLFVRLRHICQLREVSLWGRFGNRYDEAWYAPPQKRNRAKRPSIRAEIEEYICCRGEYPFVGLERRFPHLGQDQQELKKANPQNVLYWSDSDDDDDDDDDEEEEEDEDEAYDTDNEELLVEQQVWRKIQRERDDDEVENVNGEDDADNGHGNEGPDEEAEEDDDDHMLPKEFSDPSWVWCHELLT